MANIQIKARISQAVKTEAQWSTANPVLLLGEVAYSSDKNNKYKLGNGTSKWSELPYVSQVIVTYEAKVDTTWTGTAAPYTKTVTISGVTTNDKPVVLRVPDIANATTDQAMEKAFNYVSTMETVANGIKLTCRKTKPTSAFNIRVICFR